MIIAYRIEGSQQYGVVVRGAMRYNVERTRGKIKALRAGKQYVRPFDREANVHVSPVECDWMVPNLRDPYGGQQ